MKTQTPQLELGGDVADCLTLRGEAPRWAGKGAPKRREQTQDTPPQGGLTFDGEASYSEPEE